MFQIWSLVSFLILVAASTASAAAHKPQRSQIDFYLIRIPLKPCLHIERARSF